MEPAGFEDDREQVGRSPEIASGERAPAPAPARHAAVRSGRTSGRRFTVGAADDPFEARADRVADEVVRRIASADVSGRVQRGPSGPDEAASIPPTLNTRVRRRGGSSSDPLGGSEVDSSTAQRIKRSASSGRPLPGDARASMEAGFGTDLSHVRVHTGAESADLNRQLQARAFTIGNDIHFGGRLPNLSSSDGRHLMAHEIAHTFEGDSGAIGRVIRRFSDHDLAEYRVEISDVTTKMWATEAHISNVARKLGVSIAIFERASDDEITYVDTVGIGPMQERAVLNVGDNTHYIAIRRTRSSRSGYGVRQAPGMPVELQDVRFKDHDTATPTDGDCAYHAVHLVHSNALAGDEQLAQYRRWASEESDDGDLRLELGVLYDRYKQALRSGEGMPGLGERTRAIMAAKAQADQIDADAQPPQESGTKAPKKPGKKSASSSDQDDSSSGADDLSHTALASASSSGKKPSGKKPSNRKGSSGDPLGPTLGVGALADEDQPGAEIAQRVPTPTSDPAQLREAAAKYKASADQAGREFLNSISPSTNGYQQMLASFNRSRRRSRLALQHATEAVGSGAEVKRAELAYQLAFEHHRVWGRRGSKILQSKSTSDEADGEAMEVLGGDPDIRVSRLVPLLHGRSGGDLDNFKAVVRWLGGGDVETVKSRFAIAAGRPLDAALARSFGGKTSLRYLYLDQVLQNGHPSANARLVLRLGLLHPRFKPFAWNLVGSVPGITDKKRLRAFMAEDPGAFNDLVTMAADKADIGDVAKQAKALRKQAKESKPSGDDHRGKVGENAVGMTADKRFVTEAFLVLKSSGLLGEIAALHALEQAKDEAEERGETDANLSSSHIQYLFSLVYNDRREEVRHLSFKPPFRVKHLRHDLVDWATELAGQSDRAAFAAAGRQVYPSESTDSSASSGTTKPKAAPGTAVYLRFWQGLKKFDLITDAKARYVVSRVETLANPGEHDPNGRVGELEAQLELHGDTHWAPTKRMGRSAIGDLVRDFLSTDGSSHFNPKLALIDRYAPTEGAALPGAADKTYRAKLLHAFNVAWDKFVVVLRKAGLDESRRDDVKRFIQLHGSTGSDGSSEFDVIDNYLALTSSMHSTKNYLKLLTAIQPDTLEWHLAHRDRALHRVIWYQMCMYRPGERVTEWHAACALLQISTEVPPHAPNETFNGVGVDAFVSDRMVTDEDVAAYKRDASPTPESASPGMLASFYAGRFVAMAQADRTGFNMLQIAYEAQQAELAGTDALAAIKKLHASVATTLASGSKKWHRAKGENSAYATVGEYLNGKRSSNPITPADLLEASKAHTKMGVNSELRDYAVGAINEDNVLDFVDESSFQSLMELSEQRLDQRMTLFDLKQRKKRDTAAERQATDRIDDITNSIEQLEIKIDGDLNDKLRKVFKSGDRVVQKNRIYHLMGTALQSGKFGSFEQLRLNDAELRFKGLQSKAKGDVLEQRALESGVAWDHRSTASLETAEAAGGLLSTMWSNQQQLHDLATKSSSSVSDRAKQSELLDEISSSEKTLSEAQANFRAVQDRLAAQTVKIVTTAISILIAIAGLASGIGAAAGVIQLLWAIGSSVLTSVVTQVLKASLSREGDFSQAEAWKESIVSLLTDVLTFSVAQELCLAVDLTMIGAHTGDTATQLFGKPALAVLKGQINSILGGIPGDVVDQFFKTRPISNLAGDIGQGLTSKLKALPAQLIVTYVKAFAGESFRMGQKEFFAALDAEDVAWTPSTSMGGIGATDSENNTTDDYDTAMAGGFFGGGNLGDQAQFVFGPTAGVGATAWAGNEDFDTDDLGGFIGTSIKTALYEEVLVNQLKEKTGDATTYAGNVLVGGQVLDVGISKSKAKTPPSEQAKTTKGRDAQALQIVCDYFRHIGVRLPACKTPQQAQAAIRQLVPADTTKESGASGKKRRSAPKSRADRLVEMFDYYLMRVVQALPQTLTYDDDTVYEGQLDGNNERHGQGSYTWANGQAYIGMWQAGTMHGGGEYTFADGRRYSGDFVAGEFHGVGTYSWPDGESYHGDFEHDEFKGTGIYRLPDGSVYVGNFESDRFEGDGEYDCIGEWKYKGEFRRDRLEGTGTLTFTDGWTYTGGFERDRFHGVGELKRNDGSVAASGQWVMGQPPGTSDDSSSRMLPTESRDVVAHVPAEPKKPKRKKRSHRKRADSASKTGAKV